MQLPAFDFRPVAYTRAERVYKIAFVLFLLVLATAMCLMVPHYGSSGDELTRHAYGVRVLEFFTGLRHNPAHPIAEGNQFQPYGGLFDGTAALLVHLTDPKDEFLVRHYWNACFGFLGIVLAGLCGRRITGSWRTALIASIILLLTPRYFGDAFNNPKDVPFAASALFFLYAFLRWLEKIHQPKWGSTLLLGLAMMSSLSIRPGGFLFVFYGGAFSLILIYLRQDLRIKIVLPHLMLACAIGYFGCCLFWPMALKNPLFYQVLSFKSQSKLIMIGSVLFEGRLLPSPGLPRYYAFKMLFITMPFLGLSGLLGSVLFYKRWTGAVSWKLLLLHLLIIIPLLGIVLRGSIFYDGVRHLMFLVVFLSLAAGIGIEFLIFRLFAKRAIQIMIGVGLLLLATLPARFMIQNHPFEYTYYNETVGGLKGAYGYYETDYYNYSVKQGYDWLLAHEAGMINRSRDSLVLVSGCSNQLYYNYMVAKPAKLRLVDQNFATQNCTDWDYGIFISRYLDGPAIQNGYWPATAKVIHEVKADGIPLCVVLKNDPDRYGYQAFAAKEKGDYQTAVNFALRGVAQYPKDLEIWSNMARSYIMLNKLDSAGWASSKALAISGDNNVSVYYAGESDFRKGDYKKAKRIYENYLKRYPRLPMTWLGLAQAQASLGDIAAAEKSFWKGYLINVGDQYRIYKVLALLSERRGMIQQAKLFEGLATSYFIP